MLDRIANPDLPARDVLLGCQADRSTVLRRAPETAKERQNSIAVWALSTARPRIVAVRIESTGPGSCSRRTLHPLLSIQLLTVSLQVALTLLCKRLYKLARSPARLTDRGFNPDARIAECWNSHCSRAPINGICTPPHSSRVGTRAEPRGSRLSRRRYVPHRKLLIHQKVRRRYDQGDPLGINPYRTTFGLRSLRSAAQ